MTEETTAVETQETTETQPDPEALAAAAEALGGINATIDETPPPKNPFGGDKEPEKEEDKGNETQETDPDEDETETDAETGNGPKTVELTRRQREVAKVMGISDERIALMGEDAPDLLEKLADSRTELSRKETAVGQKMAELDEKLKSVGQTGEDKDASEETQDETSDDETDEDLPEIDQYSEAPDVLAVARHEMKSMMGRVSGMIGQALEQFESHINERFAVQDQDMFFANLDLEQYPQFGVGNMSTLADDSPYRAERVKISDKAKEQRIGYAAAHQSELPWARAMEEALALVAEPKTKNQAVNGNADEEREDQAIGRPGMRQTRPDKDEQTKAYKDASAFLADINDRMGV